MDDLEAFLDPFIHENSRLKWAFVRKVYSIVTLQLLVSIGFAALVASVHPIAAFFSFTLLGVLKFVAIFMIPVLVSVCLLFVYRNKHPLNLLLLVLFTLCFGFAWGVVSGFVGGQVFVEAVLAIMVVIISLILYTFWTAKRGQDFGFLVPFLLSVLVIVFMFTIFQIFFPMGKISEMIYCGLGALCFSAYIIRNTNTILMLNAYDEYLWASVSIYFSALTVFFRAIQIIRDIYIIQIQSTENAV